MLICYLFCMRESIDYDSVFLLTVPFIFVLYALKIITRWTSPLYYCRASEHILVFGKTIFQLINKLFSLKIYPKIVKSVDHVSVFLTYLLDEQLNMNKLKNKMLTYFLSIYY